MCYTYDSHILIRMATTKVTLSIPKEILTEAKIYSQKTKQPLSQLVTRYFAILARGLKLRKTKEGIAPKVAQVTGLAKSEKEDEELLFEALRDKYL